MSWFLSVRFKFESKKTPMKQHHNKKTDNCCDNLFGCYLLSPLPPNARCWPPSPIPKHGLLGASQSCPPPRGWAGLAPTPTLETNNIVCQTHVLKKVQSTITFRQLLRYHLEPFWSICTNGASFYLLISNVLINSLLSSVRSSRWDLYYYVEN
jgi:hypothetical protein